MSSPMPNPFVLNSAAPAAAGSAAEDCARPLSTSAAAVLSPVTMTGHNPVIPINVIGHNAITHAVEVRPERSCTCHPDEAPIPCQKKYAFTECMAAVEVRPQASPSQDDHAGPAACDVRAGLSDAPVEESTLVNPDATDCICEIFVGARRLPQRELPPDFHARLLEAIESDDVFADPPPLFLTRTW